MPIGFGPARHVAPSSPSHRLRIVRVLDTKPPIQGEARKLGYIAGRVDIRTARAEHLVDDDAATHIQPRGSCQLDIRLNPNANDDSIDSFAIIAIGLNDKPSTLPSDAIGALAKTNIDPIFPKIHVQEIRERAGIKPLTDALARKDHRNPPPVHGKRGGNLWPKEPAADNGELGTE